MTEPKPDLTTEVDTETSVESAHNMTLEWEGLKVVNAKVDPAELERVLYQSHYVEASAKMENPVLEFEVIVRYPINLRKIDSTGLRQMQQTANSKVQQAVNSLLGGTPWVWNLGDQVTFDDE